MHAMIRRRPIPALSVGLLLLGLIASTGCSRKEESRTVASVRATPADTVAFSAAGRLEDEAQRLAALQDFVKTRPNNPLSGEAYPEIVALASKLAPETVPSILKSFMESDFNSPDPYNAIGWNLADAGKQLDLAVPILVKAVAKARAAGDSTGLSSCLDSEAWARFKAGDAKSAVAPMEEARRLARVSDDEIEQHMAFIYESAQMPEKAQPIYTALLSHMENPDLRERLTRIVTAAGGSMVSVNAEINRRRAEGVQPATDFTLPSLAGGKPLSLSDFRGKVVLLNFWHYT